MTPVEQKTTKGKVPFDASLFGDYQAVGVGFTCVAVVLLIVARLLWPQMPALVGWGVFAGSAVFNVVTLLLYRRRARQVYADRWEGGVYRYEKRVGEAVAAVRSADENRVRAAFEALGQLGDPEEVVFELYNWIEDATKGKDVKILLTLPHIPLPDSPMVLINAEKKNVRPRLLQMQYTDGDFTKLITAMVQLVASLQDNSERLGRLGEL